MSKIFASTSRLRAPWLIVLGAITLVGGAWLTGCGSDSPTDPGSDSFLTIELTDAPTDELAEVIVCLSGLAVKHSEFPVQSVSHDLGEVDLLKLRDVTQVLVKAPVKPGLYQFIRIDLDETCSSVVEIETGERKGLKIPSQEIKVLSGFTVPQGGSLRIVLDFDADQSLIKQGNGEWLLKPVIVVDLMSQS